MTSKDGVAALTRGMKVDPPLVDRGHHRLGTVCACGDHAFAPLTRGYVALVSPEDVGVFNRKWSVNIHKKHVAAVRILHPQRTSQLMARLLLGIEGNPELVADHRNGDSIDNRRHNIRACTQAENARNQRRHRDRKNGLPKGVTAKRGKFAAVIMANGVQRYLGSYETPDLASSAYQAAAVELHGEFARW